ncbi:MAG TPA: thioredoxin-dependent thiol peroxidase [Armatimonadota bacterium]|nr:thioredoxin-dependent thiol peroxidase [Armatimonadota bacterium]
MADTMPQAGQPAPEFTAVTETGEQISLSDYRGKWVVLYFYPRDNTPGCTMEACSLRDSHAALTGADAVVLGVSTDSAAAHQRFITKFGLPFTLIADTDTAVSTRYGVYGEKSLYGKSFLGITRTTFIIDPDGIIRTVFTKVNVSRHGEEVLAAIQGDARTRP